MPEIYLARLAVGPDPDGDGWMPIPTRASRAPSTPSTRHWTRKPAPSLLRARLPNQGSKLRPGLFARVGLTLERRENALVAPEQAIVPHGREQLCVSGGGRQGGADAGQPRAAPARPGGDSRRA
ncbi:MAG: hypothetical protein MZV65_13780 [Chromatiales bacterium]|nr:hypothetical protein [Chromatiales bacterium]